MEKLTYDERLVNTEEKYFKIDYSDTDKCAERKRTYAVVKRIQDFFLAFLALAVLSPLMLLIAVIIFLDDPKGGPIFRQRRCGLNGEPFWFFKFRTMYKDAEDRLEELLAQNEMEGPAFKIKDDPRITKCGKILRKTGLDELPQLWNIIRGDMSIVGPRPPLPREVAQYNDYQRQRLLVTPGLTCYWQIQPHRNDLSFDEWVALDVRYIKERSFLVDWKIILGTVMTVLRGDGE